MRKTDSTPPDKEAYKYHLLNCCIYVKVGKLNTPVLNELRSIHQKQPIQIHYRKITCNALIVPSNGLEFISGNLFPNSENPTKIHFVLVETKALNGDYSKVNKLSFSIYNN